MAKDKETKKRRFRVQDEKRLYFVLQLILAVLEILLCYVVVLQDNMKRFGIILFAVIGIGLMLLAGKCWQNKGTRVFGRILMLLTFTGFFAVVLLDVLTTGITDITGPVARDFDSYKGQFMADSALYLQPLILIFFPTLAIAARRTNNPLDVLLLSDLLFSDLLLSDSTTL